MLLAFLGAVGSLVVLGIVQGLTEFLPVSSSGHLVLMQHLLGEGLGGIRDDVLLHAATLIAILGYYRQDILKLLRDVFRAGDDGAEARRFALAVVVANVPTAAVGLGLKDAITGAFERPGFVLASLAITGTMLFATRWVPRRDEPLTIGRAVLIGLAQSLAILPGFSRSGWTLATGLALGLRPELAARFSFLMAIPAILGSIVLVLGDEEVGGGGASVPALLAGMTAALVVGWLALAWLVRLVRNMALHRFAWYLWAVAAVGAVVLLRG